MTETDATQAIETPLVSSSRLEALDVFGVPYEVDAAGAGPLHRLTAGNGREVLWPSGGGNERQLRLGQLTLFARVASDDEADSLLRATGTAWEACATLRDGAGAAVGTMRRGRDGSVFLPFSPDRAAQMLLREEYLALTSSGRARLAKSVARRGYYRLRPVLPRAAQLALRRRFTGVQMRSAFPDWPTETALHDLREWFLSVVQEVAGRPLPQIGWWPGEARWAVVLTHDVERAAGYAFVDELVDVERRAGVRSAWYLVPERDYRVDDALVARLVADGFEICVHGLRHDGRDLQPGVFDKRLPAMQEYARRWQATGFRAPSTQRSRDVIARLRCDHDSSYSDVARFEPQGGGSCSWLPFFVGDVVELPITMPMDHTLFEILGKGDGTVWLEKAAFLRERGGMALMLTHPDYLLEEVALRAYEEYLGYIGADETAWRALPREVSAWWRRRGASSLRRRDGEWVVEGPAAPDARVELHSRPSPFAAHGTGSGTAGHADV